MIQATCYKCHKTFTEDLHHKLIVPTGTLTLKNPKGRLVGKEVVVDEIDLCPECREKLWDWLHNKEDATPGEDQPSKSCSYYAENDKKPCCIHDCNGCIWYV